MVDSAFTNPLSSFFFPQNDKNVPQALRQKIALAMLMQKRAYPKTLGEGLASIGDSIGDVMGVRQIERDAAAAEATAQKARDDYTGATPPVASSVKASSFAPADSVEPGSPQSPTQAPPLAAQLQSPSAPPGPLTTTRAPLTATPPAQQPSPTMFNPTPSGPPSGFAAPAQQLAASDYNSLDAAAGTPQPGQPGVTPARFATVRNNNPGGAYPTKDAGAFGSTGQEIIGGGHPIATYPSPVHGAAANMALLQRNYTGMPVGAAISKWSGGGRSSLPGFDSNTVITPEMASDPRLMQAIASGEAPGQYPMSPAQWQMASQWAKAGGAPAAEGGTRDRAAAALVAQQQPPAGLPPEITSGASQPDQRLAFNGAQPPAPAGIRAAPPPPQAQIQQAPPPPQAPQQGPGPGYVLTLPPEPTPPPTQTDGMRRIQNIIRNTPPSQRDSVTEALKEPYAQEQAKLAQDHAIYQDKLKSRHDLIKLQEEQRQKAASDAANVAHTNQQKNTGNIIEMPDGNKYRQDESGKLHPIQIEGVTNDPSKPPTPKMTAEQSKSQKFHGWTSLAEEQMGGKEKLLADGLQQELLGKVPFAGNKLQASEYRRVRGAAERFVQGFLRDISGAVISPEEMVKHQQTFLPRYGDDAKAIADKKSAREQIINGLYASAGPGQKISDWETERRHTARAAQETKLNEEMSGKDKAKTYEKNGVFRKWTGSSWEEF